MAADSRDLATLAELKAYCGITAATYDTQLQTIITYVSWLFADEVGYIPFRASGDETEHFDVSRSDQGELITASPMRTVTTVKENGTTLVAADYHFADGSHSLLRTNGTAPGDADSAFASWTVGVVEIAYIPGFFGVVQQQWEMMAVKQMRHEWNQHGDNGGADNFGITSRATSTGNSVAIVTPALLPDVERFLKGKRSLV